jgi:transcriptional regulator with XRE-family HTH domain
MSDLYDYKNSFPKALKTIRAARNLSQESFGLVSSRTYISSIERGIRAPTLNKIDEIATVMDVHPLTLLLLSYVSEKSPESIDEIINLVRHQALDLGSSS